MNKKSNLKAKTAFCEYLTNELGYDSAEIAQAPADIIAVKDGVTWYYEIKKTAKRRYFGAATETEWKQALTDPEHYRFVIALSEDNDNSFQWVIYTPEEMMKTSTIPPFKVFFTIDIDKPISSQGGSHRASTIPLTQETFEAIKSTYDHLRK